LSNVLSTRRTVIPLFIKRLLLLLVTILDMEVVIVLRLLAIVMGIVRAVRSKQ